VGRRSESYADTDAQSLADESRSIHGVFPRSVHPGSVGQSDTDGVTTHSTAVGLEIAVYNLVLHS
jgi:hypothetical protein